jgi:hypothetical protein
MPFPSRGPRFKLVQTATIEVRTQTSGGVRLGGDRPTRESFDVSLRDVSEGGMCFLRASGSTLDKGTALTVKLSVAGRTLALPGSVVWSDQTGTTGIRVLTQLTDQLTRTAFQRWLQTKR